MSNADLILLTPMLLGAQCVITLVLQKGEICPGQRGRLHKVLPAIGVLWLAVTSIAMPAVLVGVAIFYFYSKVNTGKTKDKGPIWLLYLANGLAVTFVAMQFKQYQSTAAYLSWFCFVSLLGASFANLLLLLARSRLEAFHRVLPISGVVSGMLMAILISVQVYSVDESLLENMMMNVLFGFALMVSGLVIWCWHLLSTVSARKLQLVSVLMLLLGACFSFQPLLQI